ncbi:hypothetical protein HNQ79_003203 [Streptomyces candidus]|uniref:Uncharacterized protein n=1 Tax=Streptomyces candidus TaxID=67283 RepID=A0A7X0HFM7_9ACTN|nr:hypothetical protein [Streptomyces candidus]
MTTSTQETQQQKTYGYPDLRRLRGLMTGTE